MLGWFRISVQNSIVSRILCALNDHILFSFSSIPLETEMHFLGQIPSNESHSEAHTPNLQQELQVQVLSISVWEALLPLWLCSRLRVLLFLKHLGLYWTQSSLKMRTVSPLPLPGVSLNMCIFLHKSAVVHTTLSSATFSSPVCSAVFCLLSQTAITWHWDTTDWVLQSPLIPRVLDLWKTSHTLMM